jgi:fructosamine-3-kinase
VKDLDTGAKYFYKSTGSWGLDMLHAEYTGVKAMFETKTIRVPRPVCVGTSDKNAFVVFNCKPQNIDAHAGP